MRIRSAVAYRPLVLARAVIEEVVSALHQAIGIQTPLIVALRAGSGTNLERAAAEPDNLAVAASETELAGALVGCRPDHRFRRIVLDGIADTLQEHGCTTAGTIIVEGIVMGNYQVGLTSLHLLRFVPGRYGDAAVRDYEGVAGGAGLVLAVAGSGGGNLHRALLLDSHISGAGIDSCNCLVAGRVSDGTNGIR